MYHKIEEEIGERTLTLETGEMAKQADGAVVITYGESMVLATVVAAGVREGIDFFPLTVEYREKFFAGGRIPGGFFKREGRPNEKEILTSRLIDRPIRPLFPDGFKEEVQIIVNTLSHDGKNDTDILSIIGSSAALMISDVPFRGPLGAVRVGHVDGRFIINPTYEELEASDLNVVLAGREDSIVMVEGGGEQVSEEVMTQAFEEGQRVIQALVRMQKEFQRAVGRPERAFQVPVQDEAFGRQVREWLGDRLREAILISEKQQRQSAVDALRREAAERFGGEEEVLRKKVAAEFDRLEYDEVRRLIVEKEIRADGRDLTTVRPISGRVSVLPRAHGSSLFTRGETQALVTATLGTAEDEQQLDTLESRDRKTFLLHYNFPPFCTGEVKPIRGTGRREVGHGALAERAIRPVLPDHDAFPYTIRVVSEILESNGSSSMATVCGSSLSLMDAGVPIRAAVAGIAMGLIMEQGRPYILTDILGLEDHLGDMDFKVAGTRDGITSIQMDIKVQGLSMDVMKVALLQAREARLHVLDKMDAILSEPRKELSVHAPRIFTLKVRPDKVRDVIGPGGKVVRGIIEKTGVRIDINDDGTIFVASVDEPSAKAAIAMIKDLTQEAEIGKVYRGIVKKIMDFGAFVEIFPGTDGLVHISQLANTRVRNVTDVVKEGDEVMVKVLEIDGQGRIRLSRKEALPDAVSEKA
ncbi:MAG: polyribonucleotide nucleotidyltransferase [Candidatus Tectomicrobia bacterium]|nr:polyribonucleotide nucleotidyltransferase [Candidatus Tectomicrobia bacterium]